MIKQAKSNYDFHSKKFKTANKNWTVLNEQKQKLIDNMNNQLQMFEDDKKALYSNVADAL